MLNNNNYIIFLLILMHKLVNQGHLNRTEQRQSVTQGNHIKSTDDLKHINENVDMMKNRVNHLRSQLQKQKDNVKKHKNLTEQVVKQKIELHKFNAIKNRASQEGKINQLKARNYSFREMHKNQMNNILKALYLVKLDDARQMKNMSMQNRKSLEKNNQNYLNRAHELKKNILNQSQNAKKRYIQYYKNKLNSVYAQGQRSLYQAELIAEEKKKQLNKLKQQQLQLLQQINKIRTKQLQAKKQYVAALSLNPKEVANAIQQKNKEQKEYMINSRSKQRLSLQKDDIGMIQSRSDSIRYKNKQQFFTKDPKMSMMSSHNIKIPRPKVDANKFQIILKELKKLDNSGDKDRSI